jgi:hypothetical protein
MTKIQPIDKRKESSTKFPELPITPPLEEKNIKATTSTISQEIKARLKAAVKKEVDEGLKIFRFHLDDLILYH